MPKIYLRVPTYLAQFYRGRVAPEQALSEFQPVEFSQFQTEYAMMSSWLILVNECDMEHTVCFSERMWRNMLNGKSPRGGKRIINRDADEWLTMNEVIALSDEKKNIKTDAFDYLCIAAPRQIVVGGQYKQVTGSFTLNFKQANELVRQLAREFKRILVHWVSEETFLCDKRGVKRDMVMCIDHFFYHYQMCLGSKGTDRESMRRIALRWIEEAKMLPCEIHDEDVTFYYDKEKPDTADVNMMLSELKKGIKGS